MQEFFKNPHNFDCPPPNYEKPDELGWTMLAKAIIANDGGLEKYVGYAQVDFQISFRCLTIINTEIQSEASGMGQFAISQKFTKER